MEVDDDHHEQLDPMDADNIDIFDFGTDPKPVAGEEHDQSDFEIVDDISVPNEAEEPEPPSSPPKKRKKRRARSHSCTVSPKRPNRPNKPPPPRPPPNQSTRDDLRAAAMRAAAMRAASQAQHQHDGVPIDPDDKEKIKGQWQPRCFDLDDLSSIIDEDVILSNPKFESDPKFRQLYEKNGSVPPLSDEPNYCYFCHCSQSEKGQKDFPFYVRFENFMQYNYEFMSRPALALMSRDLYDQSLRPYSDSKKPMRCATILHHFEFHHPSERIQLIRHMRFLNRCMEVAKTQVREVDIGSQAERLSPANLKLFLSLSDRMNDIMAKIAKGRPMKPNE